MDKVIRITSQQGFSDSWLNAGTPKTLNLCDFVIPNMAGTLIDMSKSYIAFDSVITPAEDQALNATWEMQTHGAEIFNVPTSALVRNASISNDRGQVESIRRCDTLSCALWSLTQTAESQKSDMNSFAVYQDGRGTNNYTSFNLDAVRNNAENNGTVTASGLTNVSRNLNRDIKIPLKDIFGVGNTTDYSTQNFGETRLHIETNFKNLKSKVLGGEENTSLMFSQTAHYGGIDPTTQPANTNNLVSLESSGTFEDFDYNYPFFVNQQVICQATGNGAQNITETRTIIALNYQADNTANPPTKSGKMTITLDSSLYDNSANASAVIWSTFLVRAKVDQVCTNTINKAELVLYTKPDDGNAPESLTFPTYTTEEDNAVGLTSFAKSYICEPQADAVLIACCPNGSILPVRSIASYRYAVDQVEQTGNRSIPVCDANILGSPLQYERLQRCLESQIGVGWRNGHMRFYRQLQTQIDSYPLPISMICETLEAKETSKMLNLEIEAPTGLEAIILYKHIMKTI